MPPRNAPLPNAVNIFNCGICDKGYPRQTDYESHLRSYDHNHRQRLADMKKLTDAKAADVPRLSKVEMRTISTDDTVKKGLGLGPRFKKIGAAGTETTGGSRFKKIGSASEAKEKVEEKKAEQVADVKIESETPEDKPEMLVTNAEIKTQGDIKQEKEEAKPDEDVIMNDSDEDKEKNEIEDEIITWEEYDFLKPSDCDHANCDGCALPENPVYEGGWLVLGSA